MLYKYDSQYKTLQQWDDDGTLRASMSMPKSDLSLIARLSSSENILKLLDLKENFQVQ